MDLSEESFDDCVKTARPSKKVTQRFVLGVVFLLQINFEVLPSHF